MLPEEELAVASRTRQQLEESRPDNGSSSSMSRPSFSLSSRVENLDVRAKLVSIVIVGNEARIFGRVSKKSWRQQT